METGHVRRLIFSLDNRNLALYSIVCCTVLYCTRMYWREMTHSPFSQSFAHCSHWEVSSLQGVSHHRVSHHRGFSLGGVITPVSAEAKLPLLRQPGVIVVAVGRPSVISSPSPRICAVSHRVPPGSPTQRSAHTYSASSPMAESLCERHK